MTDEWDERGPVTGPVDAPDPQAPEGDDPDDLAGTRTAMSWLATHASRWLAGLLAVALVVPAGAWLVDELSFRRQGAAVVATLDGELSGADAADTVLLVRAAGCVPGTSASGSAFVVSTPDGPAVLTNAHVVDRARSVGLRSLDGSTDLRVTGVRVSDAADVALLEVADPARLPPALTLRDERPGEGAAVRLVGFPAAMPFTTEGTVVESTDRHLLLDLEVDRGASGSPVVGDDGEVVGQVFAVTADGLGLATATAALREAVRTVQPVEPC